MKRTLIIAGAILAMGTGYLVLRQPPGKEPQTQNPVEANPGEDTSLSSGQPDPSSAPPPQRSPMADALNDPDSTIKEDIRIVESIVQRYQLLLKENPVGNNREITRLLTGNNPRKLAPLPSDHPAINAKGELTDRWGTPFFFHQHSSKDMGVVSAGEDRKMWTEDDITLPHHRDQQPPRHLQKND